MPPRGRLGAARKQRPARVQTASERTDTRLTGPPGWGTPYAQVVTDLVQGEFMQLGSKETENERFAHYLTKTYRKTGSLIANSAKAVSIA